jgi:tetratricopeptide (TPR) repeat protein
MAKHLKVEVPGDVERFFDAVERGRWEEIDAAHAALLAPGEGLNQPHSAELHQIWRAIQETWGAAREAHNWPAQKLLDYGEAVLGSLRPGMVYAGGTDPGCFIPTFLNETSEGERHITLTQNALADGTYLDYLQFLHGDRMATLTKDDSQRAFQEYLADAQKRLQHDLQFPNEPKQVKPGEAIKMIENRVQVSGQVAVMAINEKLFQMLMDKNPGASFAIEQSFPFESMYSGATPLGPIMELRVPDAQNVLTAERAAQSVDYWRATAQQLIADPQTPEGSDPRKAYAKLVSEQAALLLDRKYSSEAEQAFQIANEICPSSPEAVFRYVNLLTMQQRIDEAIATAQRAVTAAPDNTQFRDLFEQLKKMKK